MREAEEFVAAVAADLQSLTLTQEKIQHELPTLMPCVWRAVSQHLAAHPSPEVVAYLSRLWAAAKATGFADFQGILTAICAHHDFTSDEKTVREVLAKEFFERRDSIR